MSSFIKERTTSIIYQTKINTSLFVSFHYNLTNNLDYNSDKIMSQLTHPLHMTVILLIVLVYKPLVAIICRHRLSLCSLMI